ncbi:MAG: hypothetical protein ABSC46_12445 [Candidatus Limnocylindrales bacterium]
MDESIQTVASILEKAEQSYGGGPSHGRLPGWARFYAWRLLGWPGLAEALGRSPGITELTETLERLDDRYRREPRDDSWAEFCAREMLASPVNP